MDQVWYPGETIIAGISQGYMLTTPLQLANAVATLAMQGQRMRPRLLHAVQDPKTGSLRRWRVAPLNFVRLRQDSYWNQVIMPMIEVKRTPPGATYTVLHDAKYAIAGKTGSAQVFGLAQDEKYDEKTVARSCLIYCLRTVEAPYIAVAVVVENGGHGGSAAAPAVRRIMDYYLLD